MVPFEIKNKTTLITQSYVHSSIYTSIHPSIQWRKLNILQQTLSRALFMTSDHGSTKHYTVFFVSSMISASYCAKLEHT